MGCVCHIVGYCPLSRNLLCGCADLNRTINNCCIDSQSISIRIEGPVGIHVLCNTVNLNNHLSNSHSVSFFRSEFHYEVFAHFSFSVSAVVSCFSYIVLNCPFGRNLLCGCADLNRTINNCCIDSQSISIRIEGPVGIHVLCNTVNLNNHLSNSHSVSFFRSEFHYEVFAHFSFSVSAVVSCFSYIVLNCPFSWNFLCGCANLNIAINDAFLDGQGVGSFIEGPVGILVLGRTTNLNNHLSNGHLVAFYRSEFHREGFTYICLVCTFAGCVS